MPVFNPTANVIPAASMNNLPAALGAGPLQGLQQQWNLSNMQSLLNRDMMTQDLANQMAQSKNTEEAAKVPVVQSQAAIDLLKNALVKGSYNPDTSGNPDPNSQQGQVLSSGLAAQTGENVAKATQSGGQVAGVKSSMIAGIGNQLQTMGHIPDPTNAGDQQFIQTAKQQAASVGVDVGDLTDPKVVSGLINYSKSAVNSIPQQQEMQKAKETTASRVIPAQIASGEREAVGMANVSERQQYHQQQVAAARTAMQAANALQDKILSNLKGQPLDPASAAQLRQAYSTAYQADTGATKLPELMAALKNPNDPSGISTAMVAIDRIGEQRADSYLQRIRGYKQAIAQYDSGGGSPAQPASMLGSDTGTTPSPTGNSNLVPRPMGDAIKVLQANPTPENKALFQKYYNQDPDRFLSGNQ